MRLRLITIAAACAFALVAPCTALADHGAPVNDPTFDQYMRIAAEYWGGQQPQCTGPNGEKIPPHAAYGDDPNPAVGAWAEVPGCRMWLDRTHWPAAPSESHCNLVAHEYGHLLGQPHSPDQNSLMWANGINNVVPGCTVFRTPSPAPAPAPAVAVTTPPKKQKKLGHKSKRGRQRCVKVRQLKVRRRANVAKRLKRVRRKTCVRKGSKRSKRLKRARH